MLGYKGNYPKNIDSCFFHKSKGQIIFSHSFGNIEKSATHDWQVLLLVGLFEQSFQECPNYNPH
jgi:hypothetical protein